MNDSNSQSGKDKLPGHSEDTPDATYPCGPNCTPPLQHGSTQPLNDDQLSKGGLVPVQAWIRTHQSENTDTYQSGNAAPRQPGADVGAYQSEDAAPRQSANADRVKRYKENKAAEGLKQLNVIAPEIAHPVIKGIAEKTRAGTPVAEAIVEITASVLARDAEQQPTELGTIKQRDEEREATGKRAQSTSATGQAPHAFAISSLQECERQRDTLQMEVTRLRQQAAVGQQVLNLTGWRRELVSRLIGIWLVDHSVAAAGTARCQRRFFIFK